MKKLVLVCAVLLMAASVSFALDPMGPPTAGLKQGQLGIGAEYSYSETDVRANDGKYSYVTYRNSSLRDSGAGPLTSITIRNVRMNKLYANLGYGICDKVEVFGRLGGAQTREVVVGDKFDSDMEFAIGFGTKVTVWEQSPKLKVGGLFQMSWTQANATADGVYYSDNDYRRTYSMPARLDIMEMQIAAGPTYKVCDRVSLYGGPFFHFIDGDMTSKRSWVGEYPGWHGTERISSHINELTSFGGYIGAQANITDNLPFYAEWQSTGSAYALAMGLTYRIP